MSVTTHCARCGRLLHQKPSHLPEDCIEYLREKTAFLYNTLDIIASQVAKGDLEEVAVILCEQVPGLAKLHFGELDTLDPKEH